MTTVASVPGSAVDGPRRTLNESVAALGSEDFLQMLITQLRHQDPTNPMDNKEILQQLSSLRTLEANIQLVEAIEDLTRYQEVGAGASLLGREVTALDSAGRRVTGVVTGVIVGAEDVAVTLAGSSQTPAQVSLSDILEIREGAPDDGSR